jgi:hypothetical protein
MKIHRISWLVLLLLCTVLFFGCTADTQQANDNVWVLAEQINYDENGDMTNRNVYAYHDNARNFQVHYFNRDNEEYGYTDVVENEDGTKRTETYFVGDNTTVFGQTEYTYHDTGKQLSEKQIAANGSVSRERIWNWNADSTVAEILEDGGYLYTQEYDEQGREIRSYNEKYETVCTYADQETVRRTTYTDNTRVEYTVIQYDTKGRVIETMDYMLDTDRTYTDEDLVSKSTCVYDEDGYSYVVSFMYDHGTTKTIGEMHFIYKPLSEVLVGK